MILDEASSALDSKTEAIMQGEVARRFENTTTLIIAHRLSTIVHSNEILVLEEGMVKERGTHAQLLNIPKGIYANMWRLQTSIDADCDSSESGKDAPLATDENQNRNGGF